MNKQHLSYLGMIVVCISATQLFAQNPAPPTGLTIEDAPNDAGEACDLEWSMSSDDIFNPLRADETALNPEKVVSAYTNLCLRTPGILFSSSVLTYSFFNGLVDVPAWAVYLQVILSPFNAIYYAHQSYVRAFI